MAAIALLKKCIYETLKEETSAIVGVLKHSWQLIETGFDLDISTGNIGVDQVTGARMLFDV
jgi:hypothetical protein